MKTLQRISEREVILLNENQMYACFGGKDNTSGSGSYTQEDGTVCNYTKTDTYENGEYVSSCTEWSCE